MLSRIAESFYWIGRHVERAEATARLLAEHYHLTVEDRSVPDELATAVVLEALSFPSGQASTPRELVRHLIGDAASPSTVIGSVTAARENARAVRDSISSEVFEALNAAHLMLTRNPASTTNPGPAMHRVLERLMVVNGAIDWTMSRDEGHYFLTLGRNLERIDMTARLLEIRHDLLWPDGGPVATLLAAAAMSSFLRAGAAPTGEQVRRFLVLDPDFPRSMLHAARAAESAVRGLQTFGGIDDTPLIREVGLMRSRLEFTAIDIAPETVDELAHASAVLAAGAGAAAAEVYLRQAGTIVWSH